MMAAINTLDRLFESMLKPLVPILLLISRCWVAWAFFRAGRLKIDNWNSTLYLFEYEYHVPLIPWELAAYLGAATELILPVFLVLGLLTRPAAFVLFVFNIIAVISYPALWQTGFYDHKMWGIMLLVALIFGPGFASLDNIIKKRG